MGCADHGKTKAQLLHLSQNMVSEAVVFLLIGSQYDDNIVCSVFFLSSSEGYEVLFRLVSPFALYNACVIWLRRVKSRGVPRGFISWDTPLVQECSRATFCKIRGQHVFDA